jgi:hypothetical protein
MLKGYTCVRLHIAFNLVLQLAVRARRQGAHHLVNALGGSRLEKPSLVLHWVTGLELVHHLASPFHVPPSTLVVFPPPMASWRMVTVDSSLQR